LFAIFPLSLTRIATGALEHKIVDCGSSGATERGEIAGQFGCGAGDAAEVVSVSGLTKPSAAGALVGLDGVERKMEGVCNVPARYNSRQQNVYFLYFSKFLIIEKLK